MEVKVTKCQNGHYFDSNKHTCCPHCGAAEFSVNSQPQKKSGLGIFKKKEKSIEVVPERKTSKSVSSQFNSSIKVEDIVSTDSQQAFVIEDVVTEGVFSNEDNSIRIEDIETDDVFSNSNNVVIEDVVTTGMFSVSEPQPIEDELTAGFFSQEPVEPKQPAASSSSLLEEIKSVTADNDVRTVGVFSLGKNLSDDRTPVEDPVVGWMVCVKGKNIGKDFKFIAGKNSVGRNSNNNIALENEESVSREKHAWIIYEPRKREFFVKPGDSSGLTYLNDENIFDAKTLNAGDILEFGDTKFVFVPLCGENFSWSDYINKE